MSSEEKIKEELKKYQSSCERSKNEQSTKFSSISRSMIYAIIATNWVLLYVGDNTEISNLNNWLICSAILSFIYIVVDLLHYFVDTCRCVCLSKKLYDSNMSISDRLNIGQREMTNISKQSFAAIVGKAILTFVTSIVFLAGLISKLI